MVIKMRKVLVAGGAGFLGSHLCEKLISEGNRVICVDNLYTGNEANIQHLLNCKNFQFIKHNIVDKLYVDVDQIYNLACPASPIHYQCDPIYTAKTCILGSINMLDLARDVGARILQASTSEVYGDPLIHPQPETYRGNVNPIGIRACYDEGKRMAETLFFDYNRQFNVNIKILRIFNTYGPRMGVDDGRVVSQFIVQALRGEDVTIYGDGTQTRSFCYVDDLIEGMTRFMNTTSEFAGPVNIGNPCEFTVLQLAEKIINIIGSKSKIVYKSLPKDDPTQRKPVIELATQKLGWKPNICLDDGLRNTVDYFKSILKLHTC